MTIQREDPRFWDSRTLERRVRKGQLTKKDVDKHLKSLPDVTDKGQAPVLDAVDDDEDDREAGRTEIDEAPRSE